MSLPGHDAEEQVKTSIVQLSEELAEEALTGKLERAAIVTIAINGDVQLKFCGMRPSDVIGLLQIAQVTLINQLASSIRK